MRIHSCLFVVFFVVDLCAIHLTVEDVPNVLVLVSVCFSLSGHRELDPVGRHEARRGAPQLRPRRARGLKGLEGLARRSWQHRPVTSPYLRKKRPRSRVNLAFSFYLCIFVDCTIYVLPAFPVLNIDRIPASFFFPFCLSDCPTACRYVTDFPDDELWDHPRCVVIPHLGASTEEAEDAAAAMAAETIMRFLTTGEVVNSVNFPETILEARDAEKTVRVSVVNENTSGVLSKILGVFGDAGLNILQQVRARLLFVVCFSSLFSCRLRQHLCQPFCLTIRTYRILLTPPPLSSTGEQVARRRGVQRDRRGAHRRRELVQGPEGAHHDPRGALQPVHLRRQPPRRLRLRQEHPQQGLRGVKKQIDDQESDDGAVDEPPPPSPHQS